MVDADVSLYLISEQRIVRLTKIAAFAALPRRGEFVKLKNARMGDYFAFQVAQVTYREEGPIELWLDTNFERDGRRQVEFFLDEELDEYTASYLAEG